MNQFNTITKTSASQAEFNNTTCVVDGDIASDDSEGECCRAKQSDASTSSLSDTETTDAEPEAEPEPEPEPDPKSSPKSDPKSGPKSGPDAAADFFQINIIPQLHETDVEWDGLQQLVELLQCQMVDIAEAAGIMTGELAIVLVNDDEMADLHQTYSQVAGTTDVLTFDHREIPHTNPEQATDIVGDVIVCYDEASRQAATHQKHTLEQELLLYSVHGLLHLMGYDDHDPVEYQRMHQREDELLQAIGEQPLFFPGQNQNQNKSKDQRQDKKQIDSDNDP